jgi:ferredoxin-type protein NapF
MADAQPDRRNFLRGRFVPDYVLRPPWSREASIMEACTGCGECVPACPQDIISLTGGHPVITFSSECTLCGACADVCPEPVFDRTRMAFPHVARIGEACFAARGIVCQSCGDVCPETAIRFAMRLGGPALPELKADRCTGCGACIAACPADAIAYSVTAEAIHA